MVFSSMVFLFRFLPIVLVLYFIVPRLWRNLILFIVSLVFYAWGEPVYVVLMLFSTVVDYVHGRLVESCCEKGQKKKARKFVVSSVCINLLLLCFFKYSGLAPLPIGISFYTFQTMSYTIDVYRCEAKAQKNIISFGAYVALFPQLIAGPIVQYKTVAKQLNERIESFDMFSVGVKRFVRGLGKKVLFANNIGLLWDMISASDLSQISVVYAWLGAAAFALQIYFDFSGYSDMAIGLGKMFGFSFLENFDHPYESKSITEFWRRWHISLGTWFREYVYIPLGGNRCSVARQIRNIAIVWALTGIWHGASWNFLVWGIYFGTFLLLEKMLIGKWLQKIPAVFQHIYTLFVVLISWVIFAFDNMAQGFEYIKAMFGFWGNAFLDSQALYTLRSYGIILIILIFASTSLPRKLMKRIRIKHDAIMNIALLAVFMLVIAYLVDASYNPFLYFRF